MPFFILACKHSTVVYQRTSVMAETALPNRNTALSKEGSVIRYFAPMFRPVRPMHFRLADTAHTHSA